MLEAVLEGADPPEMTLDVIRGDRCDGEAEGAADGHGDVASGYAVFRDGVQAGASRSLRESKSDEARGIGPVHGGPPVGPVSREGERRSLPDISSDVLHELLRLTGAATGSRKFPLPRKSPLTHRRSFSR
jgi:hypothetical protein